MLCFKSTYHCKKAFIYNMNKLTTPKYVSSNNNDRRLLLSADRLLTLCNC